MGKAIDKLSENKFIKTIKNIWAIEDLRTRILITLLFVAIYRFGSYVVLPGVNAEALAELSKQTEGGLMALLDMFSGGAFSKASIFGLGIMPYISASIVMQLLGLAVPYFQKMQREGESGRRKMNQYTRYLTVAILLFQGPMYLLNLLTTTGNQALYAGVNQNTFMVVGTIILAAGSMFVLWLGERITDRGIGNGVSIIIMIGIIARFLPALLTEFSFRWNGQGGLVILLVEIIALFAVIMAAILLVQGVRRVPVNYAKTIAGARQLGGARQYIPLKPYAANVMPIIFAQAIMFVPITCAQFFMKDGNVSQFMTSLMDNSSWTYNIIFAVLIILFTYLYTAITINPVQMAEDMKRNNGFIPGVKPGQETADYIDSIMSKITFPGSLFLAFIAVLPAFAGMFGVQQSFGSFFGGTSLLILVGVVLDTLMQIESHLMMRHYDGLLDTGRVRGEH